MSLGTSTPRTKKIACAENERIAMTVAFNLPTSVKLRELARKHDCTKARVLRAGVDLLHAVTGSLDGDSRELLVRNEVTGKEIRFVITFA